MKKIRRFLAIIILIAIVGTITFYIGKQIGLNTDTSSTSTTIEEVTVGTQTITKTLTSSGEIATANTEQLGLSTSLYFETMCVEEDDTVAEGANILKYTNGTYLTAPYDCVISSYSVPETGTQATEDNYVEIEDLKNLTVQISINESEITSVEVGKEVEITLTADSNVTYTGIISKINATGTYNSSGSIFTAIATFENDGTAKLGMSVTCTINISELTEVLAVPIEAVQINGTRRYVIVVKDDGETEEVDVETGMSDDEYVQITSGLTGGETIQIATTTTESTIRSSSNNSSGEMGGDRQTMMKDMNMDTGGGMNMPSGDGSDFSGGRGDFNQ